MRYETVVESREQELELSLQDQQSLQLLGRKLAAGNPWTGDGDEQLRSVISCTSLGEGRARVLVRDSVGVIRVGEVQIVVHPKIAKDHFLYLAHVSEWLPRIDPGSSAALDDGSLWELVIAWFLTAAEMLLRGGVGSGYADVCEELDVPRGNILARESASLLLQGRRAVVCEFEEFGPDTALNRVVRAAALAIAGSPIVRAAYRRRAMGIVRRLEGVGDLVASDSRAAIDRTTRRYEHPIAFSRCILGGTASSIGHGVRAGWSFLIRTPALIESGVRAALAQRLQSVCPVRKRALTLGGGAMRLTPDLVFADGLAVGDVKYKVTDGSWNQPDFYQIVAFATAFQSSAGAIIGFSDGRRSPPPIQTGAVAVRQFSWDAGSGVTPDRALAKLEAEVRDWVAALRRER